MEVEKLEELDEALAAGASRILLDNFTTYDIRIAMDRIARRATVEISGGVTLERIPELGTTGAQFVSVGALTHSAPCRGHQLRTRSGVNMKEPADGSRQTADGQAPADGSRQTER